MPLIYDIAFWSLAVWPIGYAVALPLAGIIGEYYSFVALLTFIELMQGVGSWSDWFSGPFRVMFVGATIWSLALLGSIIPGVGILTSWGCLVWAKADYYDYGP